MVQDVLRAVERGDCYGRGHRREDGEGKSGEIFREYSGRAAGGAPTDLGGQDDRNAPASGAGPRAASADLQDLEHSGVWQRGCGLSGPGERYFVDREDFALLQAADL